MILIPLLTPDPPPSSSVSRIATFPGKGWDAFRGCPLPRRLSPREELRDALALAPSRPGFLVLAGTFHVGALFSGGAELEQDMVIMQLCIQGLRPEQQMGRAVDRNPMRYLTEYQSHIVHPASCFCQSLLAEVNVK